MWIVVNVVVFGYGGCVNEGETKPVLLNWTKARMDEEPLCGYTGAKGHYLGLWFPNKMSNA